MLFYFICNHGLKAAPHYMKQRIMIGNYSRKRSLNFFLVFLLNRNQISALDEIRVAMNW